MKRAWKFTLNWVLATALFNIILDVALVIFLAAISFIMLENKFPPWETIGLLTRVTLVLSAAMATSYMFSADGRREWK